MKRVMTIVAIAVLTSSLLASAAEARSGGFRGGVEHMGGEHATHAKFFHRSPFNVEIPSEIGDSQAKANAASKTWPGDMNLD
jgi:hypothetical protein